MEGSRQERKQPSPYFHCADVGPWTWDLVFSWRSTNRDAGQILGRIQLQHGLFPAQAAAQHELGEPRTLVITAPIAQRGQAFESVFGRQGGEIYPVAPGRVLRRLPTTQRAVLAAPVARRGKPRARGAWGAR